MFVALPPFHITCGLWVYYNFVQHSGEETKIYRVSVESSAFISRQTSSRVYTRRYVRMCWNCHLPQITLLWDEIPCLSTKLHGNASYYTVTFTYTGGRTLVHVASVCLHRRNPPALQNIRKMSLVSQYGCDVTGGHSTVFEMDPNRSSKLASVQLFEGQWKFRTLLI
jgi:hypothetical protein